jgi:uncharacterized damage-inducible protein DinB
MTTELDDLVGFLEGQRQAVLRNLEGLSDAQAKKQTAVSSMPLLGIVKHLSYVERRWIHMGGDAQPLEGCYPADPDKEFNVADDTVAEVVALYERVARESDRIIQSFASGDEPSRFPIKRSIRQIALHLIEETAGHAGHAAIIREAIDGHVWS